MAKTEDKIAKRRIEETAKGIEEGTAEGALFGRKAKVQLKEAKKLLKLKKGSD